MADKSTVVIATNVDPEWKKKLEIIAWQRSIKEERKITLAELVKTALNEAYQLE